MGPPKKHHHRRTRRLEQAFAEMKADPNASPQVKSKTTQKLEGPSNSESILQPRAGDAPVKTPDDDHEQDSLKDQKAATSVDQKPSSEDIDMPLASKIDPIEPHIKIEKPDLDLATRLEDQKPATGVKDDPSGVDTEMSLAPKIDPTEPSIKAEKPDPDLVAGVGERNPATGVKPDPSCEDTEMLLAPKIDPNEATATSDHSDSKRSLASFDSQDLLEETRTQNSPDSSNTKPEGQLCLICFMQWGKELKPGKRLLDCQITHGSSSSCNHCLGEHSRCGMLPSNLTRDLLQLNHEVNKALDVGEAIEEKKRFCDTYQNVSGEIHRPSAGPSASCLQLHLQDIERKMSKRREYYQKNADRIKPKHRENWRKYYQKNVDQIKSRRREYKQKNADRIKSISREYRRNNADRIKSKEREYRQKNVDRIKSRKREYRQENVDRIKTRRREY
ncbi:hypothetical protein HAV15_002424 [Penicillium sp. str. |nr:hypothetical protein HAV15_002424 [Penicillium sp. str. \